MSQTNDPESVDAQFNEAVKCHSAGQLDLAMPIYQKILEADPAHADSLHLLGLCKHQLGDSRLGASLMKQAIDLNPKEAAYYSNRGSALKALGQYEEALESYCQAIECDARFLPAFYNAGELYCMLERMEEGEGAYRKAAELNPNLPDIWTNLGICLIKRDKSGEGEECLAKAMEINPGFHPALYALGHIREEQKRYDEALPLFRQAMNMGGDKASCLRRLATISQLQKLPDATIDYLNQLIEMNEGDANVYNNLGLAYQDSEDNDKARSAFEEALDYDPMHVETLCNLAALANREGQFDDAIAFSERAFEADPKCAIAHNNLGSSYKAKIQLAESAASYRQAVEFDPTRAAYHSNLALVLEQLGEIDAMETHFRQAIELDNEYVEARSNYAAALLKLGRLSEAKSQLDKALLEDESHAASWNNLARYHYDSGSFDESRAAYERCLEFDPENTMALISLPATQIVRDDVDDESVFQIHRRNAEAIEAIVNRHASKDPLVPRKDAERLRVGLVSPDFRVHSVAYFLEPLLEKLDRSRFEVYCYSNVAAKDGVTQRFEKLADHWLDAVDIPDVALSQRIRSDGIDVLIDLAGFTHGNRIGVFALRSAPAQVAYLGYPHSTGLSAMDYRIVDAISDPEGETLNTEKLVRLPDSFLCFRASEEAPSVGPLPAPSKGNITFGSFNNITKLTPASARLFAKAMRRVSGSKLLLKSHQATDPAVKNRVLGYFKAEGIEADRIDFLPRLPSARDHLDAYNMVDIALDTVPYNGTTTTCEALWMGVPVIALAGTRHSARVSASILSAIGLNELIASSESGYVDLAASLAEDLDRLESLRSGLRERVAGSPLRDEARFAQEFGKALESIWQASINAHCESVG